MKSLITLFAIILFPYAVGASGLDRKIEVSGTSMVSITPDRITVEIGTTEYYKKTGINDSVKITLAEIDEFVYKALEKAGVADSLITLNDIGNYYWGGRGEEFLMGKRISATLDDLNKLMLLSENLGIEGVTSFRISSTDRADMEPFNRQGLKAALDKARQKAEFIAANEGGKLGAPIEIVEEGPMYYDDALAVNTVLDESVGMALKSRAMTMENMKKIVRRYQVKVVYEFVCD